MSVPRIKSKQSTHKKLSPKKTVTKEVYREIITPAKQKVSITLPEALVGKTIEVFAFEVREPAASEISRNKPFSKADFWETFGSGKGSSISAEGMRERTWRKHQW
jgi:hypothetical protein